MTIDVTDAGVVKEFKLDETNDLVRWMRKRHGYTQYDLADELGVSQAYVSAMERGDRRKPTTRYVQQVADHFGVLITFKAVSA